MLFFLALQAPALGAQKISPQMEAYYRAVYILQKMGGPAATEPVIVPRQIARLDSTENLLHHPDKIFVLTSIVKDLQKLGPSLSDAQLFEAYAHLALGERQQAADALSAYVASAQYQERHYVLLTTLWHDLGDYTSQYLMSLEWGQRDPACNEKQIFSTWNALCNLSRYSDAKNLMLRSSSCLGWASQVYAAKAASALNDEAGAKKLLKEATHMPSASPTEVDALWGRLHKQNPPFAY